MPSEPVLKTKNLGKQYGNRWAVKELNLDVMRGEIFGFLGPNGAGKSTTIRMMLSLIRPTTGSVELFGLPLTSNRSQVLARVGGLVERADFYLHLSARRNLEIVATLYGGVKPGSINRALELVGLSDRATDRVKSYSHGMKQRLGIAQSLLASPELVILDEPTTGLDPQGIVEVRELITSLSREQGMTVFLSSHLLSEIEQTATSMAIIHHGSCIVQGPVKQMLAEDGATVNLDVMPQGEAEVLLRQWGFEVVLDAVSQRINVTANREAIPGLVSRLVEHNIRVFGITPNRSLEAYFLRITAEADDQERIAGSTKAVANTRGRA